MKCNNCGFEFSGEYEFCPNCGSPKAQPPQSFADVSVLNPAADAVTGVLRDKLFLFICILMSANTIALIATGSMNLLYILFSVFLWLAFFSARSSAVDYKYLKNLSGVVFAGYVVNFVIAGIVLFVGAMLSVIMLIAVNDNPLALNDILNQIGEIDPQYIDIISTLLSLSVWLFLALFLIIGGGLIVINILGYGNIHKFAKSAYQSVQSGVLNLKSVGSAKVWMIIFAVSNAVNIFSCKGTLDIIMLACSVLCPIFAYCLIAKLTNTPSPEQQVLPTENQ